MFSAISRLWSRQMRTVWDVHHFVICSHLLIISIITLFVMLRIWNAQSDNVQVYSMSGRGEVWMNGDPHLWLSLTSHTPLTESVYKYYNDDGIDGDDFNKIDDLEYNFANIYQKEITYNGDSTYDSVNTKTNNVKNNDADLSEANTTTGATYQETTLPHLIQEYRKLYQKRMSAWSRYNSLLNSKINENAKDVMQQVKRVQFRLPVPVAAVIVQGAEITPAIASKHNFYGDRLISAYRFALLSGAPWLLITCYSETECTQALHFLLTTPDIANVLFDPELLHMMSYPKNETGSVLRESLLHSNTLQEWMLRGTLLGSLPCSFSTRNKFTCYNSHSWYYNYMLHHHHHDIGEQELELEEWSNNFANLFANSAVHESIDVNEKLAYELIDSYEEDFFEEEQEEEEKEEQKEQNNIDTVHGHQIRNRNSKAGKQLNAKNDNEFVVVNSFMKINEYEYEEEQEQEEGEEEDANVLTVEFVDGHNNNNIRYNIDDDGDSSSNNKNNNMYANSKYDAFGRQMGSKTQHVMKAYYPRYIIHEGIRFIQPGIVMVQKNATSTLAEPTVKILEEMIEMNAAEKHKMWRLSENIAKRKTVEENNRKTNLKKSTERSIAKNKHATPIEQEPEILLFDYNEIDKQHVQRHDTNVNRIVNMKKEKSHSKAERAPANESQSERTVKSYKEEKQKEELEEKEKNKVQVEPWWWWLNEEHVVFVVTSMGEQTRARLIFTKAIRDVGHDALVRLRSLIAKLINERQNELHVINKNIDSANANVNYQSNSKHGENTKANKHILLLPRNISYAYTVQQDDVHLPFASMQEYTKLFVLRPYMTGNIELFRSTGLLLPFDNKLPENMSADCSWLARKIGVYSYYLYRNYQRLLNDFISYGSSTGGYISDLSQLNILTNDYEAGRISLQDFDFYD